MGDESLRQARSTVLRLRGLPFQSTEVEIEEFFTGYTLKKCQLCKRNGRPTGEAYVQLENEQVAGKALHELNCKYVGRRYIELFEASESDLTTNSESKTVVGFVLRLRGLPYSSTRIDIESFFDGLEIFKGEEGVVFSVTSIGKPTGEAYVEFITEEDQQEAMKKHKQHIGTRYIEIFKSTKADLLQALQQNRFYKEQAQKRQFLNQTMMGIHPQNSIINQTTHRESMGSYNFQDDDVVDVLKGLRVSGNNTSISHKSRMILSPTALPFQAPSYGTGPGFQLPTPPRQTQFTDPRYFIPDQMSTRATSIGGGGGGDGTQGGNIYTRMISTGVGKGTEIGANPMQGMVPRHEMIMSHHHHHHQPPPPPPPPYLVRSPPQHVVQQPHLMFGYRNLSPWIGTGEIARHGGASLTQTPVSPIQHQFSPLQYGGGIGSTNVLQSTPVAGMHPMQTQSYHMNNPYHQGGTGSNPSLSPAATFPDMLEGEDSLDLVGRSSSSGKAPGDQI
eukprot:g5573.t1